MMTYLSGQMKPFFFLRTIRRKTESLKFLPVFYEFQNSAEFRNFRLVKMWIKS